jgi:hypothetical protein
MLPASSIFAWPLIRRPFWLGAGLNSCLNNSRGRFSRPIAFKEEVRGSNPIRATELVAIGL